MAPWRIGIIVQGRNLSLAATRRADVNLDGATARRAVKMFTCPPVADRRGTLALPRIHRETS